ncbi:Toll/interleukin-1 receptor-like protein [Linum perenne]
MNDVFVSYRGPDVGTGFKDHLYAALRREAITVFSDKTEIPAGEKVTEAVLSAIEGSRFYVVVLSKGYASSEYCLDELAKIMDWSECFPVFYNVSPDNILSGCFRRDLDRHKKRFSYRRVSKWLRALSWIAGVSGWVYTAAQYVINQWLNRRLGQQH